MNNIEILKKTNLGDSVAEQEKNELQNYFIKTEAWEMLNEGKLDIIYGDKGTGKSALYLLLMQEEDKLKAKGVHVIAGEEISGDPVFQSVNDRKESFLSEDDFRNLWKIYILTLIGNHIRRVGELEAGGFSEILDLLKKEGLIPIDGLHNVFKIALNYVMNVSPTITTPDGFSYSITPGETTIEEEKQGKVSIKDILKRIDEILGNSHVELWISFDRLDAAFSKPEVETPALRALFRVYLDFVSFKNIKLKIFLRDDIWERITHEQGFREQSHITRSYHIKWDNDSLRHLILLRFYNNPVIEDHTKLKRDTLGNPKIQEAAFYSIFPDQVESGPKQRKTFEWILTRVQDGKQSPAPREVINLIKFARVQQVRIEEVGGQGGNPQGHLISANALNLALEEVSKTKLETLWSEYPDLRKYIELFKGGKTEYLMENIESLFKTQNLNDVVNVVRRLKDIGFLYEKKGAYSSYWIPFIFRPYLSMSQGTAFTKKAKDENEEE